MSYDINSLRKYFKLHYPGYNYLGPGTTDFSKKPVNRLDELARQHDLEYQNYRNPYTEYNFADEKFVRLASRINSLEAKVAVAFFKAKKKFVPKDWRYNVEDQTEKMMRARRSGYGTTPTTKQDYDEWLLQQMYPFGKPQKKRSGTVKSQPISNIKKPKLDSTPVTDVGGNVVFKKSLSNMNAAVHGDVKYVGRKRYKKSKRGEQKITQKHCVNLIKKFLYPFAVSRKYKKTNCGRILTKSGYNCIEVPLYAMDTDMFEDIYNAVVRSDQVAADVYLVTGTTTAPHSETRYSIIKPKVYYEFRNNGNTPTNLTMYEVIPRHDVELGNIPFLTATTQSPIIPYLYEGWKNIVNESNYDYAGSTDVFIPHPSTAAGTYASAQRMYVARHSLTIFNSEYFTQAFRVVKTTRRYMHPGDELKYEMLMKGGIVSKDDYHYNLSEKTMDSRICKFLIVEIGGTLGFDTSVTEAIDLTPATLAVTTGEVTYSDCSIDYSCYFSCEIGTYIDSERDSAISFGVSEAPGQKLDEAFQGIAVTSINVEEEKHGT